MSNHIYEHLTERINSLNSIHTHAIFEEQSAFAIDSMQQLLTKLETEKRNKEERLNQEQLSADEKEAHLNKNLLDFDKTALQNSFDQLKKSMQIMEQEDEDQDKAIGSTINDLRSSFEINCNCQPVASLEGKDVAHFNNALLRHFVSKKMTAVATTFSIEANIPIETRSEIMSSEIKHETICNIAQEMSLGQSLPVIKWIAECPGVLRFLQSDTLYRLFRAHFHCSAAKGRRAHLDAKKIVRKYAFLIDNTLKDFDKAWASSMFMNKDVLPYKNYEDTQLCQHSVQFFKQACKISNVSSTKIFTFVADMGFEVLAKLLKANKGHREPNIEAVNGFSYETDGIKTKGFHIDIQRPIYHSHFVCSVTTNEATPKNPAVRLECTHAIDKRALWNLLNRRTCLIKCPFCRNLQDITDIVPLSM